MYWLLLTYLIGAGPTFRAGNQNPMVFTSTYVSSDVALQTEPKSAFWQGALPVYAESGNYGEVVLHHRTEVRSRWTNGSLYVLFTCPYQVLNLRPSPDTDHETNELWNWDVAEVFIGSDFSHIRRYKEFEVSPQGEWVDLAVNLDLPDHTVGWTWNSGIQVSARIDHQSNIWYGAMKIPFAAISPESPKVGQTFRANLFRSQGSAQRHTSISWKPPMSDTFHTPENFGLLKLVEFK